jgi:hypothetical protein
LLYWFGRCLFLVGWAGKRVVGVKIEGLWCACKRGGRGGRCIVEEDTVIGTKGAVNDEIVEVVMLLEVSRFCVLGNEQHLHEV